MKSGGFTPGVFSLSSWHQAERFYFQATNNLERTTALTWNLFVLSVGRLEERELELKKEYNSLHQRHTEVRQRGGTGEEMSASYS